MKVIRGAAISAAVALLVYGVAVAQPQRSDEQGRRGWNGDPEQMVDRQLGQLREKVGMTTEQEPQVRAILLENLNRMRALRQEMRERGETNSDWRSDVAEKMKSIQDDTRTKLARVFSPEQMASYDAWQKERREQGGSRGRGPRPPRH